MNKEIMASYLDHAVLDPSLTTEQLRSAIMIGVNEGCMSVCVNSDAIDLAKECIKGTKTKICVVCDFPFAASYKESKLAQAQSIIDKGDVFEIDIVANYGLIKSGDLGVVTDEIKGVSELCHKHNVSLKVIVETDALNNEEILNALECCIEGNADFIKTSTGYFKGDNIQGASPDVIQLLVSEARGKIKVKGSGCIRSRERLLELIELGIDRAGVGYLSTQNILNEG